MLDMAPFAALRVTTAQYGIDPSEISYERLGRVVGAA